MGREEEIIAMGYEPVSTGVGEWGIGRKLDRRGVKCISKFVYDVYYSPELEAWLRTPEVAHRLEKLYVATALLGTYARSHQRLATTPDYAALVACRFAKLESLFRSGPKESQRCMRRLKKVADNLRPGGQFYGLNGQSACNEIKNLIDRCLEWHGFNLTIDTLP